MMNNDKPYSTKGSSAKIRLLASFGLILADTKTSKSSLWERYPSEQRQLE
jgi:hypothetical protein